MADDIWALPVGLFDDDPQLEEVIGNMNRKAAKYIASTMQIEALIKRYEELLEKHYRFLLGDRQQAEKYEADLRLVMDVYAALKDTPNG